ncbi:hypothetical protein [Candidatus Nanohalobium constans]|uniref:Uncharacterized protein n=1 Tax=Candidatus Nanohalobium constans TaxID=2565781 RepID=A0A5Q0UG91_9ARCH|nr:hypothetical protein [Candidatus Nanohalobium constans]QGA80638.1 hypothetical protein LC1Nh_0753 [Candidatus Nanohalobium constans]
MSWQDDVASRVKSVEDEVEGVFPRSYAAKTKVFLDHFMPFALIMLGSLLTVNYLVPVTAKMSVYINYANWILVAYFSLRLAMAFRLAESDRKFLKQHWFDALLVIPAFTLLKEFRGLTLIEETLAEQETEQALTNLPIAAQISRIIRIIKRSIKL